VPNRSTQKKVSGTSPSQTTRSVENVGSCDRTTICFRKSSAGDRPCKSLRPERASVHISNGTCLDTQRRNCTHSCQATELYHHRRNREVGHQFRSRASQSCNQHFADRNPGSCQTSRCRNGLSRTIRMLRLAPPRDSRTHDRDYHRSSSNDE